MCLWFNVIGGLTWAHHSGVHHPSHHRGHAVAHEPGDLLGVGADGLREGWIVGGFFDHNAGGGERQLATIAVGVFEQCGQAGAHAHDFCALVEVRVHAGHVCLELRDKVRRIRLGGSAYAAGDLLDGTGYFIVPVEHFAVATHVHAIHAHTVTVYKPENRCGPPKGEAEREGPTTCSDCSEHRAPCWICHPHTRCGCWGIVFIVLACFAG
jgi:hypothetical protein